MSLGTPIATGERQGPTMVESIQAGIDWLSLTMPRDTLGITPWKRRCIGTIERIAKQGYVLASRKLQGYEGISAGNCFFGEREDGFFLQLTGSHANDHYDVVYDSRCNVPRVDVQFSAKFDVMPLGIAKKGYSDATSANNLLPAARRRKLYIIVGSDGGDTLYLGSPSSLQRGRLYNKAVQSAQVEFERTWRYEVVFRNELAYNLCQALPLEAHKRAEYVLAATCAWYESRGLDTSLYFEGERPTLPLQRILPTDIETKLQWLKTQVRPTIRYLCGLGFRGILLEELFPPIEGDLG